MARFIPARALALVALLTSLFVTATLLQSAVLSQAQAAIPVPTTRAFTAPIESLAKYQGQTVCDPVARPGVTATKNLLLATYGKRVVYIPRYTCDSGTSEHLEGRALDWMINAEDAAQKPTADAFIAWLLATDKYGNKYAMARRLGIMYIVYNNRMWRAYDTGRGWAEYKSCLTAKGTDDTDCHRNHVHLSFGWDGAMGKTSFFTGTVYQPADCSSSPSASGAAPASSKLGYVPLPTARIADTTSGVGMPGNAKCRLSQDDYSGQNQHVDVQVTGRGGVPASGVGAVALSVRVVTNAPATVTAWPAGVAEPSTQSITAGQGGTTRSTVVVPIGKGGKVSFATKSGSQSLTVDVLGYFAAGTGSQFNPMAPKRLSTVTVAPGADKVVDLGGVGGIPSSGLDALSLSLSGYGATAAGNLSVRAYGAAQSAFENLTYSKGAFRTAVALVGSSDDGRIVLHNHSATSAVSVLIDGSGWYDSTGGQYTATKGTKVYSTTSSVSAVSYQVAGVGGVPTNASSVALQVSAVDPSAALAVFAYPYGSAVPTVRHVSIIGSGARATQYVVVPIGTAGKIAMRLAAGTSPVSVHVVGWFSPTGDPGTVTGGGQAAAPKIAYKVTAKSSVNAVLRNGTATVTGALSPATANASVLLQRRSGALWTTVATAKTSSKGTYSVKVPTASLTRLALRVYKPTDTRAIANVSPAFSVIVANKFTVSAAASSSTVKLGAAYTLSGKVSPLAAGSSVTLQRLVGSSWTTVTTAKIAANGTYTFSLKGSSKGTRTLRVYKLAGLSAGVPGYSLPGLSPTRTVKVI